MALECKLRGRKVDLGIVRDFWGVVDDIPGLREVIVSPTGFTSGAIQYAQNKGTGLKIIRPANQEDYHGRVKMILISFRLKQAVNLQLQTNIDIAWYEKNKTLQLEEFLASMNVGKVRTDRIIIEDRGFGEVIILAELQNHLPVLAVEDISVTHTWTKTFRDGYIVYPNGYELKLISIEVDYEIQQSEPFTVVVGGEEVAHVLIQDALAGTLLFVDGQGLISGDTEEEGISKSRAPEELR